MDFCTTLKEIHQKNPSLKLKGKKIQGDATKFEALLKFCYDAGVKDGMKSKSLFDNIFGNLK